MEESPKSICARFCEELDAGNSPKIESFLNAVDSKQRGQLTEALKDIKVKYALRQARKDFDASDDEELNTFPSIEFTSSNLANKSDDDDFVLDATSASETEVIAPGKQIGRYKLLRILGAGGMGAVWLAEQSKPVHRRVALKLIRVDAGSGNAVPRFEAERQAIAMMDHPNIAKIYDAGTTEGGNPFFVMELVPGIPLNEYCDVEKLTVRERLELMIPVLNAVQHAHQKAIIHRDLKHSNVLVASSGDEAANPKVIDFGLAKALGHHRTLTDKTMFTEAGCVVGTLQYMSPEQADNKLDVDTRTDIYSLGVMLYKLLTGTTPLGTGAQAEASLVHLLSKIRSTEPSRPSMHLKENIDLESIAENRNTSPEKLIASVGGDLDWIIMKALDKDRRLRYETANGLAMDLQRYLNDETVLARPPSSLYFVKKFVKRNRGLVASVASIITLLVAGIIATSMATMWALDESAKAIELSDKSVETASIAKQMQRAAETKEAEVVKLQAIQEVELHASGIQQAWSDWQLNNAESAWKRLDVTSDAWEDRFLRTQFTSSKKTLHGHSGAVITIDAASNGRYFASASIYDTVKIWNATTQQVIHTLYLSDKPSCVRFSPNSKFLATADLSNQITIWNAQTGEQLNRFEAYDKDILCIDFSPDGTNILIGFGATDTIRPEPRQREIVDEPTAPKLEIIDFEFGSSIETLSGHSDDIVSVEYSADGQLIMSASKDGKVRIWRKGESGFAMESVLAHPDSVECAALSPSGKLLLSGSKDKTVSLWDVETGKRLKIMAHDGPVTDVAFSTDEQRLASCSDDRTARVWNLAGEEQLSLKGHFDRVRRVTFSQDGSQVLTSSDDATLKIWDSKTRRGTITGRLHDSKVDESNWTLKTVWGTDSSWDQKSAISVCQDGTIAVSDMVSGEPVFPLIRKPGCEFLTVSASPTNPIFVTGDSEFMIRVWDLNSGELLKEFAGHEHNIWYVHFSSDGKKLVSACQAGRAKVWDTNNWKEIGVLDDHEGGFCSARFSHDGKLIVTASDDHLVRLYDAEALQHIHTFRGHELEVWRAVFSPDDRLIASSGFDGVVFIWDVATKKIVRQFRAHQVETAGLTFSRDGSRLLTGCDDGSIRIWDVETATEIFELREPDHSQCVSISLSKDGTKLISGSGKGSVTVRSAIAMEGASLPLRPQQRTQFTADGLVRLKLDDLTKEELQKELEIAESCCNYFPYFNTWTNLGIAQCRLEQYKAAESSLREAKRQEALQYGYNDLLPTIEAYLAISLHKQGKLKEANQFKDSFVEKIADVNVEPWIQTMIKKLDEIPSGQSTN